MIKLSNFTLLLLLLVLTFPADAQRKKNKKKPGIPAPTEAQARLGNLETRKELRRSSLYNGIEFRSVGPTVMSGRVVDLAVNPEKPTEFYVAYASGGLWHTDNNGTSFEPLFQNEMVMSIGDIAVDWERDLIYIGSGENNSSRSSYSGVGMYRSRDKGRSWEWMGLPDSHHIGRIVLHPTDPNTLWVAVLGHLYSESEDRGVYKTTDGGATWRKVLYTHPNAGAIDLVINPNNSNELFAALWDRQRRAWDFIEGGDGTGIHKSVDGGETWSNVTGPSSGFPQGEGAGRIGLAIFDDGKNEALYAVIDNQDRREPDSDDDEEDELEKDVFEEMTIDAFADLDNSQLEEFLRGNGFPDDCDSTSAKQQVASGELKPSSFFDYLHDSNASLFDTPVKGAEVYSYDFKKGVWNRTHEEYLDDLVYSYGYYFSQIRIHPNDKDRLYIMGVPIVKSDDGGKTWESISQENVHADHHALWINPNLEGHIINGNDGGVNISYDDGETYIKCNNPAVGQFYTVQVDNEEPYNIYGGLQDNGVWKGPSTYEAGDYWHQSGKYPYEELIGGDGMQIEVDPRDNRYVYTGYQFGNYYRVDTWEEDYQYFQPKHELGETPLRWNWQTPIELSSHNADILYMGSNKFHRSMDKGETWKTLSKDLTRGGRKGDVSYGTLTSISESELQFGYLVAGSDDGLIHVSKDGGMNWTKVHDSQSQLWVTRVQFSTHEKGRIYASLNGYRWDDFRPYLMVSDDFGQTWVSIGTNLPLEPINVVREDPNHPDILYVGTDHGLYISDDRGKSFQTLGDGLPAVAVHDIVIQRASNDLVVGTHGRSIFVGNIEAVSAGLDSEEDFLVFEPEAVRHRSNWGSAWNRWLEADTPNVQLAVYSEQMLGIRFELMTTDSLPISKWGSFPSFMGYNTLDIRINIEEAMADSLYQREVDAGGDPEKPEEADNGKFYLPPGEYRLRVTQGTKEETVTLMLE